MFALSSQCICGFKLNVEILLHNYINQWLYEIQLFFKTVEMDDNLSVYWYCAYKYCHINIHSTFFHVAEYYYNIYKIIIIFYNFTFDFFIFRLV